MKTSGKGQTLVLIHGPSAPDILVEEKRSPLLGAGKSCRVADVAAVEARRDLPLCSKHGPGPGLVSADGGRQTANEKKTFPCLKRQTQKPLEMNHFEMPFVLTHTNPEPKKMAFAGKRIRNIGGTSYGSQIVCGLGGIKKKIMKSLTKMLLRVWRAWLTGS